MDASLDLSGDFGAVADRLEPVELRRRDGSPPTRLASALRRAVSTREAAASDGKYTAADARWHLSGQELAAAPLVGDQIVDGRGAKWTILKTRLATCGSRWECIARDLEIAAGLNDSISIRREIVRQDRSGAAERTWQDERINVRARIQELTSERALEHGRQSGVVTARIYLAEQILVDGGYQIAASDGRIFEVVGFEAPDAIGSLFTIIALRRL